ncbi:MAG: hypothetical protein JO313_02610 [Verrucomicrobia bacterium]|nr:hypothetical protein [Verrucomicrobiota bacterium]
MMLLTVDRRERVAARAQNEGFDQPLWQDSFHKLEEEQHRDAQADAVDGSFRRGLKLWFKR